jgi:hypothetical protein
MLDNKPPEMESLADDLVWYDGHRRNNLHCNRVTLAHQGAIYIGSGLGAKMPNGCKKVAIAYGPQSQRLVIEPVPEGDPRGILCIQRRRYDLGIRLQARSFLTLSGIRPVKKASYEGVWTGQRIVAIISENLPESTYADPPSHVTTHVAVGSGSVSSIQPEGSSPSQCTSGPRDAKGDDPRCITCDSYATMVGQRMFGTCRVRHGESVRADQTCEVHSRLAVEGEHIATCRPPATRVRQGSRPRYRCPKCKGILPVSGKGVARHDIDGVMYTGGRGDPDKPCPGSYYKPSTAEMCRNE